MWNISSQDLEHAKERVRLRRSEIEARHADELKALDTELEAIAVLERAAADFASKHAQEDVVPDPAFEPAGEAVPDNGGEASGSASMERRESGSAGTLPDRRSGGDPAATGSRWRLHLGNRPADAPAPRDEPSRGDPKEGGSAPLPAQR